ncbi:hypothetical protein [uncultured Arthrobacter sp.]|uniref:hypothetical protein n=1 Tax=uncultured Arthrobacter sp. TaxID=114050 RepID=UPI0028D37215|nr:hypothetical protein [uncultured Arthrobacter sp.]
MFASLTEYERSWLSRRTRAGLAAAKARAGEEPVRPSWQRPNSRLPKICAGRIRGYRRSRTHSASACPP